VKIIVFILCIVTLLVIDSLHFYVVEFVCSCKLRLYGCNIVCWVSIIFLCFYPYYHYCSCYNN